MNLNGSYYDSLLSIEFNGWEPKWWDPKDILGGYRYDKTGGRLNIEWLAALGITLRSISIDLQPGNNWLAFEDFIDFPLRVNSYIQIRIRFPFL